MTASHSHLLLPGWTEGNCVVQYPVKCKMRINKPVCRFSKIKLHQPAWFAANPAESILERKLTVKWQVAQNINSQKLSNHEKVHCGILGSTKSITWITRVHSALNMQIQNSPLAPGKSAQEINTIEPYPSPQERIYQRAEISKMVLWFIFPLSEKHTWDIWTDLGCGKSHLQQPET